MDYDTFLNYGDNFVQPDFFGGQQPDEFFMPPSGGGQSSAPMGAPPNFSPPIPAWQQGSSGIRMCLYRNTYIWLRNGSSFWFFPTFVSRNTIIGFRWRGIGWIYQIINPNNIRSYVC